MECLAGLVVLVLLLILLAGPLLGWRALWLARRAAQAGERLEGGLEQLHARLLALERAGAQPAAAPAKPLVEPLAETRPRPEPADTIRPAAEPLAPAAPAPPAPAAPLRSPPSLPP